MLRGSWSWWIRLTLIGIFSVFFLIFGVEVLIGAYGLNHPQFFIMYFFSGSFIVLVSFIGILYPVFQIYELCHPRPSVHNNEEE